MVNKNLLLSIIVGLVVIILLGQINAFSFLFSGLANGLENLSRPLFYFSGQFRNRFQDKAELQQEIKNLRHQFETLVVDYAELEKLKRENEVLKDELGFVRDNQFKQVTAVVMSKSSLGDTPIYVLNKGARAGVREGMPVIYGPGVMVGKIIKVTDFTSQMLQITNQNLLVAALVQNKTQTAGLVKGEHNISMRLDFIPQDKEIEENQVVVTSGEEKYIPYGIVIGKVISVTKSDSDFFQSAALSSPVDFSNIQSVLIIVEEND